MTRTLVTILLPLVTPFVLYFAWSWYARRSGLIKETAGEEGVPAPPWTWLAVAGIGLAAAVLVLTILLGIDGEGGTYYPRSEEHTSELQSLMRISDAVFCLKKKTHEHETTCIRKR